MIEIDKALKETYNTLYSDKTEAWRKLGAKGKARNIIKTTKGFAFKNIIEVGAGDGNILQELSNLNFGEKYTAVEISQSAIEQTKKKNILGLERIVQFDGYKLPFDDKSFDLAICSHVIEHVEHPRILLREIKRISKQQVFEIPIDFSINVDKKVKHFTNYGHINIYNPPLFDFLLKTEGFQILKSKSSLYQNKIISFQHGKASFNYWAFLAKKAIWQLLPFLMRFKPNAYTVHTK